jgi:hypothetical protein
MTTVEQPTRADTATREAWCNFGQFSVTYEGPDPERIS